MPLIASTDVNVIELLKNDQLIPDVFLESTFSSSSPSVLLEINYPNGHQVTFGNTLTPQDTKQAPQRPVSKSKAIIRVVVMATNMIMVDPDAPSRQDRKFRYWRHWITQLSTSDSILSFDNDHGHQHTPYVGPGPGADTGDHRYLFLLYKQSKLIDLPLMPYQEKEHRRNFDVHQFAKDNQLELIAVNYFLCSSS